MSAFDEIQPRFPVRNTEEQKAAFRDWAIRSASEAGWAAKVEPLNGHNNVVIGDADGAKVILTAHYDTPRRAVFPNLMIPRAKALFWIYQIAMLLPLLAGGFAAAAAVFKLVPLDYTKPVCRLLPLFAYLAVYFGLVRLFLLGAPNRHNANDNTSGVSVVLGVMRALPEDRRKDVALILFDDEEKGKKGSRAFANVHAAVKKGTPVLNFDCVGVGDQFVVLSRRDFAKQPGYAAFKDSFAGLPNAVFFTDRDAQANSDQTNFTLGTVFLTCRRAKSGLLYTPRIHTDKDTEASQDNIDRLTEAALGYIETL